MTTARGPFLEDAILQFRKYKGMAGQALSQLSDDEFFRTLDPESNSPALIVKHVAGNMRSRWDRFLETDGEKNRDRDGEFEIRAGDSRDAVMARWETGWATLFAALEPLSETDLARTVRIRGEPHTVLEAIHRQMTHYAYHIGQVVLLAKHMKGSAWKTLSIPRGKSREFEVARDGTLYKTDRPFPT